MLKHIAEGSSTDDSDDDDSPDTELGQKARGVRNIDSIRRRRGLHGKIAALLVIDPITTLILALVVVSSLFCFLFLGFVGVPALAFACM